jgi:2-polyprenyl-6-methoxyphenol hydroxylase-like FAD-dependent oxidoreductase
MNGTKRVDDSNVVLIIGGGVAGLVLAQGLKRQGIPFKVFERDSKVSDKGYRFRVADEGVDALRRTLPSELWDLLEETHPESSPPNLFLFDAITGNDRGKVMSKDTKSYPMDRPWLKQLLHTDIKEHIYFDKAFERYELLPDNQGVVVTFADGTTARGAMLVGADGVRSKVRQQLLPSARLLDVERTVMWGRTPLTPEFEKRFNRPDILEEHFATMIDSQDPRRCCLFAPIRWPHDGKVSQVAPQLSDRTDYLFWALSFESPPTGTSLKTPEERVKYGAEITKNWGANLRTIFEMQRESSAVPVWSSSPQVPVWKTDARITFMGDAIHCMSPSGGSGGLTAIVDAAKLSEALGASYNAEQKQWVDLSDRLEAYETDMRVRAKTAIEHSFNGGKMLW